MRNFRSIRQSFNDCPFKMTVPKTTIVEPFLNIDIHISSAGKPQTIKYVIKECRIIDKLRNDITVTIEEPSNFVDNNKKTVIINEKNLMKKDFMLIVCVLTQVGDYVEVTYVYERNKPTILKSVAVGAMTEDEENLFSEIFEKSQKKIHEAVNDQKKIEKDDLHKASNNDLQDYVEALSSEMFFLKNNGGKKHKVTDGRLLTPNSNEYCYSFELESELYLSDDAPVSVIIGLETVQGNVIVCDGFQIIVSLNKNIGEAVQTAFISVEPWKLLESLRDRIAAIRENDRIAWKLFKLGPNLADKNVNIDSINRGQDVAITHAINNDITAIWGPPGTGKTYTMAQITEHFVAMGKSVLIVSHSNISVDNVVKQISKQFTERGLEDFLRQGKALRYGFVRDEELSKNDNCVAFNYALNSHEKIKEQYEEFSQESRRLKIELEFKNDNEKAARRKDVEKQLKKIRTTLKTEAQELAKKAQVLATTVSKIYMDKMFETKKYDVVMFDEVSMAYVPQLLCAATFATEKFICVGDFRQLAPIVQSEKAKGILQKDIFEFLSISRHGEIYNHPWLVMLNEQRRMHPRISKFSNKKIYKGLLKDHSSVETKWNHVVEREPLADQAMNLVDLAGTFCAAGKNADNSRFNILSAILSFGLALKAESSQGGLDFKEEERVGIITPYAAQTRLIRAMIQDYREKGKTSVSCATVHQFQGSERNVVIFDAVESYPFTKPGWLVSKNENSSVLRLINVALTRARCKFITLANTKFWYNKFSETRNTYFSLLEHIQDNDNVIGIKQNNLTELLQDLDYGKNIKLMLDEKDALELLLSDIRSAKKRIGITFPTDKLNKNYKDAIFNAVKDKAKQGISVIGKAKDTVELDDNWNGLLFKSKDSSFSLISIDGNTTWYGFPLTELYFKDKDFKFITIQNSIFRIRGKHTNEMISSLCDLEHRLDERGLRIKLTDKADTSASKGLTKFVNETERCKQCQEPMDLIMTHNGKFRLKCSECGNTDFLSYHTLNKYLDKINAKCSVCGKNIYAGVSQYGLYVKCNNGHFTKLTDI